MQQWIRNNDALGAVNRGIPCESGLCTLCDSSCKGKCETWLSCLEGRKMLYPRRFGFATAGAINTTASGIGYHALRIQGYPYGASGIGENLTNDPDDCIFTNVEIKTEFGSKIKTRCRIPIIVSTDDTTGYRTRFIPPDPFCL